MQFLVGILSLGFIDDLQKAYIQPTKISVHPTCQKSEYREFALVRRRHESLYFLYSVLKGKLDLGGGQEKGKKYYTYSDL